MKSIIIFLALIISLSLRSQTTVYGVRSDGTLDKSSYEYYDHASGKVLKFHKDIPSGKDTVHNVTLRIISNKIYSYGKRGHFTENPKGLVVDKIETTVEIGYLTSDKKIINLKNGEPTDEALAPYIKDNKIFSADNKIIAFIEGQEIYGAASYLLSQ
jgi:hypothetical protein